MDTTTNQYMSAMSCQVVSWVVEATSPLWAIFVVTECNVKWNSNGHTQEVKDSCQLKSHRKLNGHEGSPRVTRVKHHPWLYIPLPFYQKGHFTLAPPTGPWEFPVCSLRREEWLQCPITGIGDVWCKNVSWDFCLIQKPVKAITFSHMFFRCL